MERSQATEPPAERRNTLSDNQSEGFVARIRTAFDRTILKPMLLFAGTCHARCRRFDTAVACFARAVAIDPESFAARVRLGTVFWVQRDFVQAERQFLEAQRIDPKRFDRSNLPSNYAFGSQLHQFDEMQPYAGGRGSRSEYGRSHDEVGFEKVDLDGFGSNGSGAGEDAIDRDPFDFGSTELFDDGIFEEGFELSLFDDEPEFLHGDFSSYDEWKRFQSLPPITREEIRNVDWDRILPDLR